jgi:hypothetical protein
MVLTCVQLSIVPAPVIKEAKVEPVVEKVPDVEVKEPEKVVAVEKVVEKAVAPPPAPVVEAKREDIIFLFIQNARDMIPSFVLIIPSLDTFKQPSLLPNPNQRQLLSSR